MSLLEVLCNICDTGCPKYCFCLYQIYSIQFPLIVIYYYSNSTGSWISTSKQHIVFTLILPVSCIGIFYTLLAYKLFLSNNEILYYIQCAKFESVCLVRFLFGWESLSFELSVYFLIVLSGNASSYLSHNCQYPLTRVCISKFFLTIKKNFDI